MDLGSNTYQGSATSPTICMPLTVSLNQTHTDLKFKTEGTGSSPIIMSLIPRTAVAVHQGVSYGAARRLPIPSQDPGSVKPLHCFHDLWLDYQSQKYPHLWYPLLLAVFNLAGVTSNPGDPPPFQWSLSVYEAEEIMEMSLLADHT